MSIKVSQRKGVLEFPAPLCLLLLLASTAEAQNVCRSSCMDRLYRQKCGGAKCVIGFTSDQELQGLCSRECRIAINGGRLMECLRQDFPQRDDVSKVQQTFATLIDSLCVSRQFKTTKKSVNTENETPPVTTDSPQEDQTSDNSQEVQQEPLLAPSSGPEVVAEPPVASVDEDGTLEEALESDHQGSEQP